MPSLSAILEDKPLAFAIMFAALLVVIILLFLLYRFTFGRRLKASAAGRARQPRLGIVDAFDLDRQRQLVIVRRDNVEHLIMIGGPNDVVLESAIVRTQSVASMPPGRDKEMIAPTGNAAPQIPAITSLSVAPPPAAPPPVAPPLAAPPLAAPPGRSGQMVAAPPAGVSSASVVVPPPPPPAIDRSPIRRPPAEDQGTETTGISRPPQPAPQPRTTDLPPIPRPPSPPVAAPRPPVTPAPPRPALTPRPLASPPSPPSPRPSLSPLPPRSPRPVTPPPSFRADPPPANTTPIRGEAPSLGGVTTGPGATAPDNAPPVGTEVAKPSGTYASPSLDGVQPSRSVGPATNAPRVEQTPPKGFETLESLEEEMAKLLGRTTPRREG